MPGSTDSASSPQPTSSSTGGATRSSSAAPPVLDEVGYGDDAESVLPGIGDEVRRPRHGAVVVHDLADHRRGVEAGQPGEVYAGLRLPGALQYAAGARHEREHVARRRT